MTPQQHCELEDGYCKRFVRLVDNDGNLLGCPWTDCPHDTRSRPAPSAPEYTLEEVIKIDKQIRHAQQVAAAKARNETLDALERDFKGRYVEDAVAEIRRFPESLSREVPK